MANARFATDGKIGAGLDERTTDPEFELGTTLIANDDTVFVYGQASEAVTSTCTLSTTTWAITDLAGNFTADVAFAANEYGFVRQTAKLAP